MVLIKEVLTVWYRQHSFCSFLCAHNLQQTSHVFEYFGHGQYSLETPVGRHDILMSSWQRHGTGSAASKIILLIRSSLTHSSPFRHCPRHSWHTNSNQTQQESWQAWEPTIPPNTVHNKSKWRFLSVPSIE